MPQLKIQTLPGIPLIHTGDDLAGLIVSAAARAQLHFENGDILVVAQKIVSKAEGRLVNLADVRPTEKALALAAETEKDPRLVQLILDESSEILRKKPGVIIVRHKLGIVGANAGIDQSNITLDEGEGALLLPVDPDRSAQLLHQSLREATGCHIGVLIGDSHNRPWRMGTIGGAIGCAGFKVLDDRRGDHDMFGRELKVTMINRADSICATATLLMGETDEGTPVALVKGFGVDAVSGAASEICRPLEDDLFQ